MSFPLFLRILPVFFFGFVSLVAQNTSSNTETPSANYGKAINDIPNEKTNLNYANGIVVIVEDKIITANDVRSEIAPLIPNLKRKSHNNREFNEKIKQLQDSVVQNLINRILIVKEFYKTQNGVPQSLIANAISGVITTNFGGNRSKYLAYLQSRGISQKDYAEELEETIAYQFMLSKKKKSATAISPAKIKIFYNQNKDRFYQESEVHLRLIQITRSPDDTDDTLKEKAKNIINQLNAGASFADLARLFSQDTRRTKGGDWGWQRNSAIRKEFRDIILLLKKGEHSAPLIILEGAFVLCVEDKKPASVLPLHEVCEQIERTLQQISENQTQKRWFEKLRRNRFVRYF